MRNQQFSNPAVLGQRQWLANTTFRGRYAAIAPRWTQQRQKRRFWRGRVLGWYDRTFWPYAYYDTFDYVFWPYAYDLFWPYAYDDLYFGIFGPYAYGPPAYAPDPGPGPDYDREPTGSVCSNPATNLANIPIQRIAETVKPTGPQAAALDELARATARAVQILQAACPTRLPSTPTGRLAAMQSRLEAMLRAVETIAPAMEAFYRSLNDEQRAQFDSLDQERDADDQRLPSDLAEVCDGQRTSIALPLDRIEEEVRPNAWQRAALDNLARASARAAEILQTSCPTETALTPVGRIAAIRQRLTAMLDAVIAVRPALEAFYNALDYEQRARFNLIGAQEG